MAAAQVAGGSIGSVSLTPFVIGLIPVVSGGAVGGVLIDANGVLRSALRDESSQLRDARRSAMQKVDARISRASPLRKISLARLESALIERLRQSEAPTDEMALLAGLTRVRYVFVYPEQQDLVLAGPAEGWQVDGEGTIVGTESGSPTLLLEDLVVALRTAESSAQGGIACSIDPTSEGLQRLQEYAANLTARTPDHDTIAAIERELGPQSVMVRGVPESSHFARVLVAADYRMKRLAMGFEKSPVRGLTSYLRLVNPTKRGIQNLMPRWWLATSYEPLLCDQDDLAWELRGPGVRAMAESDVLAADGTRTPTGRADAPARRWAEAMTARYDELSRKSPIFGQLRNVMDLAVVSVIIESKGLTELAGCSLPLLTGELDASVPQYEVPRTLDSRVSFVKKKGQWVLCASGGVELDSWQAVKQVETTSTLTPIRTAAQPPSDARWWWD